MMMPGFANSQVIRLLTSSFLPFSYNAVQLKFVIKACCTLCLTVHLTSSLACGTEAMALLLGVWPWFAKGF